MAREFFSKAWLKKNSGPSSKVEFFKAGELDAGSREGWFYRVDEPGRKGEWLGPYATEASAQAEANAEVREHSSDRDGDDHDENWD